MKFNNVLLPLIFLMFAVVLTPWSGRSIAYALAPDQPFDSYGDVSWAKEKLHFDNFAIALQHDPTLIGYIIVYAGQRACVDEAEVRARRAMKYLVETRRIQERRIKWLDGGYREKLTVILQPVPLGEELTPAPTVKTTDVQLIKNCKPKGAKRERSGF